MDPILHETQVWRRAYDPDELPRLIFILHAMVVAAAQFVDRDRHPQFYGNSERLCARLWNAVLLTAMDQLSVEDLQAFIIGAFNDVRTCPRQAQTTNANILPKSAVETLPKPGPSLDP